MKLQDQSPDQCVWFLDYDGSLCPHHEVWEPRNYDVREIFDTLQRLSSTGAEILWNTGRRVESLGGLDSDFLKYSGYFVQGSVYWDHQNKSKTQLGPNVPQLILNHYDRAFAHQKDYRIEHKPTGMRIAPLHLKNLNTLRVLIEKEEALLSDGEHSWEWHFGHRGSELLPVGYNKGFALRRHLAEAPDKVPVVIGDDSLDQSAAVEAFKRGGYVIAVGSGCGWVTEIPHRGEQLVYFDTPRDALNFINSLK